jgi:hypothetical protein
MPLRLFAKISVPAVSVKRSVQGRFFDLWTLWKTAKVTNSPLAETIDNFKRGGLPQIPQALLLKTPIYPKPRQAGQVGHSPRSPSKIVNVVGIVHFLGRFPRECVPKLRRAHLYNYFVIVHTDKHYRVFCSKGIVAEGARW